MQHSPRLATPTRPAPLFWPGAWAIAKTGHGLAFEVTGARWIEPAGRPPFWLVESHHGRVKSSGAECLFRPATAAEIERAKLPPRPMSDVERHRAMYDGRLPAFGEGR